MKIKFKHRADNYFWVTALLIFIVGTLYCLISNTTTLNINVHDTYFVIDYFHFTVFFTLLYFFLGAIYWILYTLRLNISAKLTKLHAKATTGIVFIYLVATPILNIIYKDSSYNDSAEILPLLLFVIFILVQPLLLINIIVGLVRGKEN